MSYTYIFCLQCNKQTEKDEKLKEKCFFLSNKNTNVKVLQFAHIHLTQSYTQMYTYINQHTYDLYKHVKIAFTLKIFSAS